jgi:hypothetical protein
MDTALIIVGVIAALVVLLLVVAALQPNSYRVERSAEMHAPPDRVFAQLNDFHTWEAWSPWDKIDPNLKRTYSGPESGKGSVYDWEGNKQVGMGRMEITESLPQSKITIKLDFFKPFVAHNTAEFTLEPRGGGTAVTWAMIGQKPFLFKVVCLFMSMDNMVGKDFEKGLANLKGIVEKAG